MVFSTVLRRSAFTLIELLVVVAIIAILASLVLPFIKSSRNRAKMVRETNAARNIMVAYLNYASNNDGDLLPGYDKTAKRVTLPSGTSITGEMVCRYPWRIAPYINEQIDNIFLVNDGKKVTKDSSPTSFNYQYRASLNPALGINGYCIGGYNDGSKRGYFSSDVVTKLQGTVHASRLLVFASARMRVDESEGVVPGNHMIIPPKLGGAEWAPTFDPKGMPADTGNVDFRWDNKAVCSFLDGHVALMDLKELSDMRNWSNQAVENDDHDFSVPQ